MLASVIFLLLLALLIWAVPRWVLSGPDLSQFDTPMGERFSADAGPDSAHSRVVASLGQLDEVLQGVPLHRHIAVLRPFMDGLFPHAGLAARFVPVDEGGVCGEWVLAPGADPSRRLLYIHGGGFTMGSPLSHRRITSRLSELTGAAVFAARYRLMPEHPRLAGIEDCRAAYRWLLDHGPEGPQQARSIWVAGDSAGGNLTLSLVVWGRDAGVRQPDAAVAFSPLTDATLSSPSIRGNLATDPMLGRVFGHLARLPQAALLWLGWLQNRVRPCDPRISPVYADLAHLPPVLVQASEAEILADDARRWVNKARAAGSPARLQTWPHMVHVWQIYHLELPEGRAALDEAARFLTGSVSAAPQ